MKNTKWIESLQIKRDAQFLWHAWWFPRLEVPPSYGKGIAILLGWSASELSHRYKFWNSIGIIDLIYDEMGGIRVKQEVYSLLEKVEKNVVDDGKRSRHEALQRVLKLLLNNVERVRLSGHITEEWTYDIIRHWRILHDKEEANCKHEANLLSLAASNAFDYTPL